MLKTFFSVFQEGVRVRPSGFLYGTIAVIAVPLTLFDIWAALLGRLQPLTIAMAFAVPMYAVAFVTTTAGQHRDTPSRFDWALALVSLTVGGYMLSRLDAFEQWIGGLSVFDATDIAAGAVFLGLTLELLRRCVGPALFLVVIVLCLYALFGHGLEGMLGHPGFTPAQIVEGLVVSQNTVGIFGLPMEITATYAFLFVVMGKFFQTIGGGQFFFDMSAAIAGRRTGGVAKVAMLSSALFGTISGSPTADVMTTGSITIPTMKRLGYPPRLAGAVEAVASTGGSLLPPVMGAVAFLMAELTAIPYSEIIVSAVTVGLLYYASLYVQVHLRAEQLDLAPLEESAIRPLERVLRTGWFYLVPFALLVWLLLSGFSADFAAAITALVVVGMGILPWTSGAVNFRTLADGCVGTVVAIAPLIAAVAAAGIVVGLLEQTGLTGKLSSAIFAVTGKNLFPVLVASMVITIVLGMGMPVVAAYMLVAVLVAPLLLELGVGILQAHFFLVYYAVLSFITPPIAIACYAAAAIAEESPMKIGWESMRIGLVTFVVPFIFVYDPAILMIGSVTHVIVSVILAFCAVGLFAFGIVGWWRGRLGPLYRVFFLAAGVMILVPEPLVKSSGVAIAVALVGVRLLGLFLSRAKA